MKKLRVTLLILATLLITLVVVIRLAQRNIQRADFGPLAQVLKAPIGEVLTVPLPERVDPVNHGAELFDTYEKAIQVVRTAAEWRSKGRIPSASTELSTLSPRDRVDGWGKPFCLQKVGDRIAAISNGPSSELVLSCDKLSLDLRLLPNLPSGLLYRYSTGALAFLGDAHPSGD